ncbi:MAG: MoxR family ATPase [Oscillospiraceae bacterium]|nr:MoxR family ATPase [Oscillospiraceae bacterium]
MTRNTGSIKIVREIINETKKAVIGKDKIIIKILLAILAKGHVLIEDIPGVGKTTMALAFSKCLSLDHNRIQFTPDVLPTDVTGFTVFNKDTGSFDFKPGASMCNLLLADEINRTSSKTQSALLEIMEEGKVTVDGITRELPKPFIVIATQNPIGSVGTQALPESQLDRFMIKLSMGYPDIVSEVDILKSRSTSNPLEMVNSIADADDIIALQKVVEDIYVDDKIYTYLARLAQATRNHPMIKLGISPRGVLALMAVSKATALLKGRTYIIPDDISYMYKDTFAHRLILSSNARISNMTPDDILDEILENVKPPEITFDKGNKE